MKRKKQRETEGKKDEKKTERIMEYAGISIKGDKNQFWLVQLVGLKVAVPIFDF